MIARILVILLLLVGGAVFIYFVPIPRKVSQAIVVSPTPIQVLGDDIAEIIEPIVTEIPITTIPRKRAIKLGIVMDDYRSGSGIKELEGKTGKKFNTISIYKQFGNGNNILRLDDLGYVKTSGKQLLVAWEPWNPDESSHQSRDYLKEIGAGVWDSYIVQFAEGVKSYGGMVVIRFGHEMNGYWYPWGNRPVEYKIAYQRIYHLFKTAGVNNAKWMWSVNAENVPNSAISNLARYYPGSNYVDIIGLDGFNFGTSKTDTQWRSFEDVFDRVYHYALTYSKPIIISEMGCAEVGGNKAKWMEEMGRVLAVKMPKVEQVVWFNLNKETDWRIDSSPASTQAWSLAL